MRTDKETLQAISDVLLNAGLPKEILDLVKPELSGLERCSCGHWRREHDGPCLWIDDSRICDCKQFKTEIKNGRIRRRARAATALS